MARGLDRAAALTLQGGHATRVDATASVDLRGARGRLEVAHRLHRGRLELNAFAAAYAGMSRAGGSWRADIGAVAGLRATF